MGAIPQRLQSGHRGCESGWGGNYWRLEMRLGLVLVLVLVLEPAFKYVHRCTVLCRLAVLADKPRLSEGDKHRFSLKGCTYQPPPPPPNRGPNSPIHPDLLARFSGLQDP